MFIVYYLFDCFFFKQKTAYEMRISDWSSDVCSSDLVVIGTPLGEYYPRENAELQKFIAAEHLLISQVPVLRYGRQNPQHNRFFFPERNATMSALTLGTIIVEAGETSGTLTQARAAFHQGRKLFILDSCFQRTDITWPARFEKDGALRVRTTEDTWKPIG